MTQAGASKVLTASQAASASAIAAAVLRQAEAVPFYVPCGHPWLTVRDEPPRPPGRPRVRATAKKYPECRACHGLGFR